MVYSNSDVTWTALISNHHRLDCLFNILFERTRNTSKLHINVPLWDEAMPSGLRWPLDSPNRNAERDRDPKAYSWHGVIMRRRIDVVRGKENCCYFAHATDLCNFKAVVSFLFLNQYNDVIMNTMAFQITGVSVVYSTVLLDADQRKHQSSASLACAGNSPVTGELSAQKASNAKNLSIWWRHHAQTEAISPSWFNMLCRMGRHVDIISVLFYTRCLPVKYNNKLMWICSNIKWVMISQTHDDVIKWKHLPRNWPFVRGIHRDRWIPHTKASDAERWCFLWSVSE